MGVSKEKYGWYGGFNIVGSSYTRESGKDEKKEAARPPGGMRKINTLCLLLASSSLLIVKRTQGMPLEHGIVLFPLVQAPSHPCNAFLSPS